VNNLLKKLLIVIIGVFITPIILFGVGVNPKNHYSASQDMLKVGYIQNSYGPWPKNITISEAAQKGYNVLIIAFGNLRPDKMEFYGDQFLAYTKYNTFTSDPDAVTAMTGDIQLAKSKYGLKYILVSVGGATCQFTMGDPASMAKKVGAFLDKFYLDGIDFDLEQVVDAAKLNELIMAIKTNKPGTTVTAAPQFNEIKKGTGICNFVTTGTNTDYTTAINKRCFDYLFPQFYNTASYTINGYTQKDAEFISAAFNYIIKNGLVPATTIIVPGEPSCPKAGGQGTIYHNPKYKTTQDALNAIKHQASSLKGKTQFGGMMTWSVNQDADNGYGFANTVLSVL
jgi:chitinase